VEGSNEPLGLIEVTDRSTLEEVRVIINEELENVPPNYSFLVKNHETLVKISSIQEKKMRVKRFSPNLYLKQNLSIQNSVPSSPVFKISKKSSNKKLSTSTSSLEKSMRETEEIFTKTLERHNSRVLLDNQCTPSYSSKSDSDYNSHDNFEINRNKSSTLRRMEVQNNLRSVRQFWRAMEESVSTSASPDVNLNSTSELQNDMKDQKSLEKLSIESDSDEHEDQSLEKIKETFGTKKKFSLSFPSIAFEISNEDSSSILRKRKSNSIIGIEKPDFLKESQASALEFYDSTVPLIQPSNLDWKVEIGFRSALNLDIEAGLESSERYDTFYSGVFYGKEHINYLGQNNKHGPVIISILKEQVDQKGSIPVIIRTQMEDKKIFLTGINFNPKNKYKEALKAVQLKYPELLGKTKLFEKMGSEIAKDLQSFNPTQKNAPNYG